MSYLIDRRGIVAGALGTAALAASARAGVAARRYRLVTEIELSSPDAPAELWVPLFSSVGDYQRAAPARVEGGGRSRVVRDPKYGAPMVHVAWERPGGDRKLLVSQEVTTRDRRADGAVLSASEQRFWTASVESLPTGGLVSETARKIVGDRTEPKAKARAIYEWVVDNTFRNAATRGCGIGGIENMLRTGFLGGKCADINSLMVGLCRAARLPARDAYGVRLGPSNLIKVLGTGGPDATHAQHCRAEVWLAGEGWFPVDPADVRKVVLDGKAAVDSPLVKAERERLFGSWEMNWAVYNHATDIKLPGARARPDENFLMYPLATTPKGELDQLDPDTFRYKLTSTVLA